MKALKEKRKLKIVESQWYTLKELFSIGAFETHSSYWSVRNIVQKDKAGRNVLKAQIIGEGRIKRYHIRGENLLKFKAMWEKGTY